MIKDICWYDEQWNPVTGSTGLFPTSYGKSYCNRFKGDVRLNLSSKDVLKVTDNLFVIEKPFPSGTPNHYIDCPAGDKPTFHKSRLSLITEKYKTGRNLLVCGMAELFDDNIPDVWIKTVLETCVANPQHNYIFLTTNINRLIHTSQIFSDLFTDNMWFGLSPTESMFANIHMVDNQINAWTSKSHLFLFFEHAGKWSKQFLNYIDGNSIKKISWIIAGMDKYNFDYELYEHLLEISRCYGFPFYVDNASGFSKEKPKAFERHVYSEGRKKLRVAKCGQCKGEFEKKLMHTIGSYVKRGEGYKVVGWLCEECYEKFKKQFE